MKESNSLQICTDILNYAKENNLSINKAEAFFKKSGGYVRKAKKYIKSKQFQELYETVASRFNSRLSVTQDTAEDFDKRSSWTANRDADGKIIDYSYTIYIHDEKPLTGKLTREQLELIYQYYPSVTINSVSKYFPFLTYIQFKRILRCFNITKDKLFPVHILEEKSADEVAELVLNNREKAALDKIIEKKGSFTEKKLFEVQESLYDIQEYKKWLKTTIETYFTETKQEKVFVNKTLDNNEKALFIYLSDMHIGASNTGSQFSKEYNTTIIFQRLNKILNQIREQKKLYGKFDSLFVLNLGDMLDGYNQETTRTGHALPQNMNNREQFKAFLDIMIWFFNELIKIDLSNSINYYSIGDDNHSGDIGYNANLSLKYIFDLKFPDIKFTLFEKYIEHFTYGDHVFIANHGKDKKQMKNNLPLHLDQKTELFFVNYLKVNNVQNKSVIVVKGDLHQYNTEISKNFRYTNIPSIYGGSPWTDLNFGYTQPGFVYQIISKNSNTITETYLGLD